MKCFDALFAYVPQAWDEGHELTVLDKINILGEMYRKLFVTVKRHLAHDGGPGAQDYDAHENFESRRDLLSQITGAAQSLSAHTPPAAQAIIEYVRTHHNSRSDELMRLIAIYDAAQTPPVKEKE